ncbi:MAG: hypothetical protein JJT95_11055 [Pararhodobacter sp.]|nr:hypothetical protein [Pararhodobacter sp.]
MSGTATPRATGGAPVTTSVKSAGRKAARLPGARKRRLRTLPALVVLFCLAGAIRLALGIDGAFAQGPATEQPAGTPQASAIDRHGDSDRDTAAPVSRSDRADGAVAPDGEEIASILLDIRRRESQLAERAEELDERLALLTAAEQRIARQIEALRDAEAELDATMALADRLAEDDLGRLVSVFEAMRAEQAARVFAEMDPDFAAGFLGRLRPDTAAGILAELEPRQAYALSTVLAGRNATVPRRENP